MQVTDEHIQILVQEVDAIGRHSLSTAIGQQAIVLALISKGILTQQELDQSVDTIRTQMLKAELALSKDSVKDLEKVIEAINIV